MKHQFCVYDACSLHALQGTVVLAGKAYLDNIINHVNVMEVPDIENWVQANEFLMTTGYMYKDSPRQFADLIPKLKERGVAALGIKTKRFLDSIPDSIIACAEENGLPLLLLPEQTAFSLVIRECMEEILLNEKGRQGVFLKNLLLGRFPSEQEIYANAEQIGFDFPVNRLYTLLLVVEHEDHVMYEKEAIYQTLKSFFYQNGHTCHHIIHENHIVIILSYLPTRRFQSSPSLEKLAEENGITLCCYTTDLPVTALSSEYECVVKMAKAAEYNSIQIPLLRFESLGLYSILPDISGSLFHYYCREKYLLPLETYDAEHGSQLKKTLETYLQCACNMKESAAALYIHYNTICYRIAQIQELLQIDFHDMNQLCTLYLAFLFQESNM